MTGWRIVLVLGVSGILAGPVLAAIGIVRARHRPLPKAGGWTGFPSEHGPALIGALLDRGRTNTGRLLVATWLDLIRRGILPATPIEVVVNGRAAIDLQLSTPTSTPDVPWERTALEILAPHLRKGPRTLAQILRALPVHGRSTARAHTIFSKQLDDDLRDSGLIRRSRSWRLALPVCIAGWVLTVAATSRLLPSGTGFVVALGVAFVLAQWFVTVGLGDLDRQPGPVGSKIAGRWRAAEAWMADPQQPGGPADTEGWAELLVYSLAIGRPDPVWNACDDNLGLGRCESESPLFIVRWNKPAPSDVEQRPRILGIAMWLSRVCETYSIPLLMRGGWSGVEKRMLTTQPPEEVGVFTTVD